jgi:hypothetical protein
VDLNDIFANARQTYLARRDPELGHVRSEDLSTILDARIRLGKAPLDLLDCEDPIEIDEVAPALEAILRRCTCGCARKEMIASAAIEIIRQALGDPLVRLNGLQTDLQPARPRRSQPCQKCPEN